MYTTSLTQHCVRDVVYDRGRVRSTCRGGEGGVFLRSVVSFIQPNVSKITLMEDNEGAREMAGNALSSGRSKHINVR